MHRLSFATLAVLSVAACAPRPQPVVMLPAPPPGPPRVVEVLPPAQPFAGLRLPPQSGDRAYGGGGVVLEHRDGMTRPMP